MSRFLLDANLSPKISEFLQVEFAFDIRHLVTIGAPGLSDEEVIALAKQDGRVIITLDKDFGETYYLRERGEIGVILLRVADQRTDVVREVLRRFFSNEAGNIDLDTSLVVIEDDRTRVVRPW